MNNSGYSSSEILSMQEDAIRRVREMQRRANDHLVPGETAAYNRRENPPVVSAPEAPNPARSHDKAAPEDQAERSDGIFGLLSSFGIGEDKAVVLAIIFILLSQNADKYLILALLYLIL